MRSGRPHQGGDIAFFQRQVHAPQDGYLAAGGAERFEKPSHLQHHSYLKASIGESEAAFREGYTVATRLMATEKTDTRRTCPAPVWNGT